MSASGSSRPSAEEVHRQLEGRDDVVVSACTRYAALEALLSASAWKRRLREHPDAIQALLRHEPALDEALERIQRRAQVEHWAEDLPVLAAVRRVGALRERLEALVRKRLAPLSRGSESLALKEALPRLEELVLRPIPLELAAGEVRVLEGSPRNLLVRALLWAYGSVFLGVAVTYLLGDLGVVLLLGLMGANVAHALRRSGRYVVTNERLVWHPRWGEPVQLPLRSIEAEGVVLDTWGVRVTGARQLFIPDSIGGAQLAAVLAMHRHPPLRGARALEPLFDVVCFEGTHLTAKHRDTLAGCVVLRPGYVAFLPQTRVAEVLQSFTGAPPFQGVEAVEIRLFVEQLRHAASAEVFDDCIAHAVKASLGVLWKAEQAFYDPHEPVWKEIRFWDNSDLPSPLIFGKVGWDQQERAEWLMREWSKVVRHNYQND